jgi:hypothetical protein
LARRVATLSAIVLNLGLVDGFAIPAPAHSEI